MWAEIDDDDTARARRRVRGFKSASEVRWMEEAAKTTRAGRSAAREERPRLATIAHLVNQV